MTKLQRDQGFERFMLNVFDIELPPRRLLHKPIESPIHIGRWYRTNTGTVIGPMYAQAIPVSAGSFKGPMTSPFESFPFKITPGGLSYPKHLKDLWMSEIKGVSETKKEIRFNELATKYAIKKGLPLPGSYYYDLYRGGDVPFAEYFGYFAVRVWNYATPVNVDNGWHDDGTEESPVYDCEGIDSLLTASTYYEPKMKATLKTYKAQTGFNMDELPPVTDHVVIDTYLPLLRFTVDGRCNNTMAAAYGGQFPQNTQTHEPIRATQPLHNSLVRGAFGDTPMYQYLVEEVEDPIHMLRRIFEVTNQHHLSEPDDYPIEWDATFTDWAVYANQELYWPDNQIAWYFYLFYKTEIAKRQENSSNVPF